MNCLATSLMKCIGETISVELKDKSLVKGTLAGADVSMNLHLRMCEAIDSLGEVSKENYQSVRGNSISMVILPDKINMVSLICSYTDKQRKKQESTTTNSAALGIRATKGQGVSKAKKPRSRKN
ncbi:MAG: hypothetical protein MHPSP_002460 [Paramarteilia canceri]